jgi:acetyl esterase/lipase
MTDTQTPEEIIRLWPDGPPTGIDADTPPEGAYRAQMGVAGELTILRNVSEATLAIYRPTNGKPNGVGVIVAPGGGWRILAWEHEGTDVVAWLTARGYTAFLLKYRLRATPPDQAVYDAQMAKLQASIDLTRRGKTAFRAMGDIVPFGTIRAAREAAADDGRRAIEIVRQRAPEWGLADGKIGMIGFSAGAFLTADVAMDPRAAPLAFVAPIYGGETLGRPVPDDAPPLFTVIAQDDFLLYRVVEGLYADWTDAGRSAELHIYRRGQHGFGMIKQGAPVDRWIELFGEWLGDLGLG